MLSFTLLTTASGDARLEDAVTTLSLERARTGLFPVSVVSWTTIRDWLGERLDLARKHYPELTPRLEELLHAQARRIDAELPGTTLEIRNGPRRQEVIVRPGPAGVEFGVTFERSAGERFDQALREGNPVQLQKGEYSFQLPKVLEELFPEVARGAGRLTVTPSQNGRSEPVSLLVHPASRYPSHEVFLQRARRSPDAIPARHTVEKLGSEVKRVVVTADRLPLAWILTQTPDGSGVRVERRYANASIESVLEAERLLVATLRGGFGAVFGPEIETVWYYGPSTMSDEVASWFLSVVQALADLSEMTGWELSMPERLAPGDVTAAMALRDFFTTGRRTFPGPVKLTVEVPSENVAGLQRHLREQTGTVSFRLTQPGSRQMFLGELRDIPASCVTATTAVVSQEVRNRVVASRNGAVQLEMDVLEGGTVVEELLGPVRTHST